MGCVLIIILSSYLFGIEFIDDSMSINYIPISARSSAMGGIYVPLYTNEKEIAFSHLSRFGGIYELDAIKYNNIVFTINGVENIANTTAAWNNIDSDGPLDPSNIDYSKISYFDIKDYNIILSKIIKNKYNISIKTTFSKIYNQSGVGLGLNIVTTKREVEFFDYYIGIYDLVSFKTWFNDSNVNNEFFKPKFMLSLERTLLRSLNILTLYGLYENNDGKYYIDYRFGSNISLTNNVSMLFGKSTFTKFSVGFSITNKLINVDYSYIISGDDLPFDDSYNIGIRINISKLIIKGKDFYP